MSWISWALLTAVFYGLFDFFVKKTAGKVEDGLASITFIKVFSAGSNLSIGVMIVRVGMILLAVLLGVFVLQEKLILKQIIGIFIALFGLFLVLAK